MTKRMLGRLSSRIRRRSIICVMLIVLGVLSVPLLPERYQHPNLIGPVAQAKGTRGFIGLPLVRNASTLVVQNVYAAPIEWEMTYYRLPDLTNPVTKTLQTLAATQIVTFTAPGAFGEYSGVLSTTLPVDGVSFELSEEFGNDAYLAKRLNDQVRVAQPEPILNSVYLPSVAKFDRGRTTDISIQNLGTVDGIVEITIYRRDGTLAFSAVPEPLSPREIRLLDLDTLTLSQLPDGFAGSAVVRSDQPVAITSVRTSDLGRGLASSYAGVPASEAGSQLVAPGLFKASDFQTSQLCVQDASGIAQTVAVTYTDSLTAGAQIPANGSHCFDQGQEAHAAGWSGGATIVSQGGGQLAAVVNVTSRYGITPIGDWSYSVASSSMITRTLLLPLIGLPQQGETAGWAARIHLYNPGDTTTVGLLHYYGSFNPINSVELNIPPRTAITITPTGLPTGTLVAGGISVDQPVAAVVSFTSTKPLDATDRHFGYVAAYQ